MNQYLAILLRSTGAFFLLLILTRLMGRKQISQLTFFDYISGITIGTIIATLIIDSDSSDLHIIIALLVWIIFPIVLGFLDLKSAKLRKIINGEPLIVISNGEVLPKNMAKAKYNMGDLLIQLREKDIFDLSEVEFAILEPNGMLSVLKKSQYQPTTPNDLGIQTQYKGLTIELILNGNILYDHLKKLNLDKDWLLDELKRQNIDSIDSVVFAGLQSDGTLYVASNQ